MATFEEAKQLLEAQGPGGSSVFDHLSDTILKILNERPADAVAAFEDISLSVKRAAFAQKSAEGKDPVQSPEVREAQLACADSALAKLKADEEGAADAPEVQDLVSESLLLEWAGISLGRRETFLLQGRMRQLVKEQAADEENPLEIKKLRFWGKILGRQGVDYYVFEATCDHEVEIPEGVRMENQDGANRNIYFVCRSTDMGRAIRLPHVTEAQITVARQIKKFFTGDLSSQVSGYPPFPGTEANFLRAQIALISSDTLIAPAGWYVMEGEEEDQKVVFALDAADNEEPLPKMDFDALNSAESWTHCEMAISSAGRMLPVPEVENADGEPVPDPFYGEVDATRGALDGIAEEEGKWRVQRCPSAGGPGSVSVVKSLQWPGAVAAAQEIGRAHV